MCAHLVAGIGPQTMVVVLKLYFNMFCGALLASAQTLHTKREDTQKDTTCKQMTIAVLA